jgi:hypothetical protein
VRRACDGPDIDLSATAGEFAALLCEFKTDIATYLQTYVDGTNPAHGEASPQTLADLIAFDQNTRGWKVRGTTSSSSLAEETNGRGRRLCRTWREATTPPVQAAIQPGHGRQRSRRDHRADQRPRLAERTRTLTRAISTGTSSTSSGRRGRLRCRLRRHHGCPPATSRDLPIGITFIGGPLGRTGSCSARLDYEQGDATLVSPPQFIPTIGDALFPGVPNPPAQARCGGSRRRKRSASSAVFLR